MRVRKWNVCVKMQNLQDQKQMKNKRQKGKNHWHDDEEENRLRALESGRKQLIHMDNMVDGGNSG